MFGLTVTFSVAVAVAPPPSVAVSVKPAVVAPQAAIASAVTVPLVLTIFDTVTPFTVDDAPPLIVTVTPLAPLSLSLTVAIVEFEIAEPACRVTAEATMVGAAIDNPGVALRASHIAQIIYCSDLERMRTGAQAWSSWLAMNKGRMTLASSLHSKLATPEPASVALKHKGRRRTIGWIRRRARDGRRGPGRVNHPGVTRWTRVLIAGKRRSP